MDASAPPAEWTDEKSRMNQPPPPPYHEHPGPGYPQPNPGYPQPHPGYPQPNPGYPQPNTGYPPQPQGNMGLPPYGNVAYGQQYPPQAAVMTQPVVYAAPVPLVNPAPDYLCYSIFTMLFCCLPLGVAALIHSISTREANQMGDRMRAEQSSKTARTLNHVALGLGLGVFILAIAIFVMFVII